MVQVVAQWQSGHLHSQKLLLAVAFLYLEGEEVEEKLIIAGAALLRFVKQIHKVAANSGQPEPGGLALN